MVVTMRGSKRRKRTIDSLFSSIFSVDLALEISFSCHIGILDVHIVRSLEVVVRLLLFIPLLLGVGLFDREEGTEKSAPII